jgi:hypothetical protein
MKRLAPLAVLACTVLALGACGSDDAADSTSDGVVDVTLTDFSFGDLPDEVPAGTRFEIDNQSDSELHEMVAVRLADGDNRTTDEIVDAGLEKVFAAGPPAVVLLEAPGGEQIAAVGDGVLAEPGRYLVVCAIPTGADAKEYLDAAATSDGPPQVDGGPPHFMNGMIDDIVVTAG